LLARSLKKDVNVVTQRSHGMEAYPQKVRELVLGAYEEGDQTAEIAEDLKVSRSWSRRVKQRLRESGSRKAIQQKHGFDPKLGEREEKELAGFLDEKPDSTLKELKTRLSKPVSVSTICRTLQRMKLTLKKSRCTPASRTGRM
jgi:transposase